MQTNRAVGEATCRRDDRHSFRGCDGVTFRSLCAYNWFGTMLWPQLRLFRGFGGELLDFFHLLHDFKYYHHLH